jgi:hypothetical protein
MALPSDFFFPFAHLGFRPQSLQFRRGPRGKDLKDRMNPRFLRNWPTIDHGHVSENMSICVL